MSEALAADTVAQADATPQKAVRRWLLEIKLAEKREKDWRKTAHAVVDTYRGTKRKKNSFNILWANTEVLRPALYNSTPKPDVRRRFRQHDLLGKAVSEVAERSLSYCIDAYDLDNCLQNDTLDALLPGRGLSRVRYVPKIKTVPKAAAIRGETESSSGSPPLLPKAEGSDEAYGGDREEVEYEQALCEHVQWDDFLHGPGKTWEEVQWVAFRARLTKDDLVEKFGKEIADKIRLDDVEDSDLNNQENKDIEGVFKRAVVWEIWDKQGEKVFFLNESHKDDLLYPKAGDGEETGEKGAPPLRLKNFFPVPRPLQMVEDTGTLIPEPLYELYREQAEELDRLSGRINKIINACRVRFIYDSTMTELKTLMDSSDNDGIPSESARAWMQAGGVEKAVWFMPVQQVAMVLKELYVARASAKEVVYEITGISDIIRGVTNPNETLGAQQLKANSSSLRLQRMQREVQRYTRDLIRLLAEVIGENFDPQTLAQMTGLQFPTAVQKQQAALQMQAAQMQKQPGDPNVQNMLQMPSWDDIMAVLRSDIQREYRVDVETDSTVAQSLQQDMEGMREVLTSVVDLWQGVGPAVQSGAVSMDAVKAITMSIVRRARMGLEVEDALESGMQEPKQPGDPAAQAKAQEAQAEAQKEQAIAQREQQNIAAEQQAKESERQQALALDAQQKDHDRQIRAMELEKEDAFNRWKVEQDNAAKIAVAEIGADAQLSASLAQAEEKANTEIATSGGEDAAPTAPKKKRAGAIDRVAHAVSEKLGPQLTAHAEALADQGQQAQMHGQALAHVIDYLSAPKTAERDATGRLVRLTPQMASQGPLNRAREIQADASGRPAAVH